MTKQELAREYDKMAGIQMIQRNVNISYADAVIYGFDKALELVGEWACKGCEYNFIVDDTRVCDDDPQKHDYCYRKELLQKLKELKGEL